MSLDCRDLWHKSAMFRRANPFLGSGRSSKTIGESSAGVRRYANTRNFWNIGRSERFERLAGMTACDQQVDPDR